MNVTNPPLRVYVEYEEDRSGGEPEDPADRWTSHATEYVSVNFISLFKEPPSHKFFYDSIELPNDKMINLSKLYLAVVRYGTGDTFHHTSGAWYIVGIAPTRSIAEAMLAEEVMPSAQRKGVSRSYKRWEGYFESLEDTEVHELDLI